MTNTEAQQVLGTMLMRYDLTDAELEAIGMAGEALEDDWIPVERTRPPINEMDLRSTDNVLVANRDRVLGVAWYDYQNKIWMNEHGKYYGITHWRHLPKGPEVD